MSSKGAADPYKTGAYPGMGDPELGAAGHAAYRGPGAGDDAPVHEQGPDIRRGFARKVFGILFIQLVVTSAIVALISMTSGGRAFVIANPWLVILALVLSFGFLIALACFPSVARSHPSGEICLACFTVLEAFLVGVSAARYDPETILIAAVGCAVLCGALGLFASQTSIDFTRFTGIVFALLIVAIIIGIASIFIAGLRLVYLALGLIVFSAFLVIDVQLVLGGKGFGSQGTFSRAFGVDDYVIAALNIYLDIVNIFLFLLALIGGGRR